MYLYTLCIYIGVFFRVWGFVDGDGGSHDSDHRLRIGINAGASAEKVGVVGSLGCGGVGEGAGAGSAQSSFVGVAHETGTEAGAGVVFCLLLCRCSKCM